MIHHALLTIGMPLWIAGHTTAPHWLVSGLLLLNTVMVVLFQVRASRGTEDLGGAAGPPAGRRRRRLWTDRFQRMLAPLAVTGIALARGRTAGSCSAPGSR